MRAKWDHPVLPRHGTCLMTNGSFKYVTSMNNNTTGYLCTLTILHVTFAKGPQDTELFIIHWFATVVHVMPSCFGVFSLKKH